MSVPQVGHEKMSLAEMSAEHREQNSYDESPVKHEGAASAEEDIF